VLRSLFDSLVPPACLICRMPPPPGGALCAVCRARMPWIEDPCPRCALPRGVPGGCPPCPAGSATFLAAWAPVLHTGPARDLLLALKLRGATEAADAMAAQMHARAPQGWLGPGTVIVPVPGLPSRRRRRGFDPAEQIAAALGRRAGVPVVACLRRDETAVRQLGGGRGARRRSVPIVLARAPPATAERVVLVDDVHTTGRTLETGAAAVASGNLSQIAAATYVRTPTAA